MIRLIFMFLWFMLVGCSGQQMSLVNDDTVADGTDLDAYLAEHSNSAGDVPLSVNAGEEDEASAPPWSRELHSAVENEGHVSVKSPKKAESSHEEAPKSSHGKKRRSKVASRDVVGDKLTQVTREYEGLMCTMEVPCEEDVDADVELIVDVNNSVDILFVLDVSKSMRKILQNIQEKMQDFLPAVASLDWRIGFLKADIRQNRLADLELNGEIIQNMNFITQNTRDYERIFFESIAYNQRRICVGAPGCGSRKERPLGALEQYLKNSSDDFLRGEDTALKVVIIADNDENKFNRRWQRATSEHVLRAFRSRFGNNKSIKGYSLTVMDEDCRKSLRSSEGHYAPIINEFVDRTTGPEGQFSICLPSYGALGSAIVQDHFNQ